MLFFRFSDQLAEMFSEPPEWDGDRKYTLDNIHVYFEDPDGCAHMVNIDNTLGQIISDKRYRVDGGTPSFIVLAKGTKAEERFLNLQ
ncbi:Tetratricopeptide repeat protein 4 [Homalodisca vitripennis]|nr:Tetratricopeptide repeat protein 4 [Homalodisca vitripennis]